MARSKMKLEYIRNNASRRSTLRKRSRGILKKVEEISVLCGTDACGIIYSPDEDAPQVWPQPLDARRILTEFNNLPELERTRKMTNHLAYMQERLNNLTEKVVKSENANNQVEVRAMLYEGYSGSDFAELSAHEVWAVGNALDELMSKVFEKMRVMSMNLSAQAQTGGGVAVGPGAAPAIPEVGPSTPAVMGDFVAVGPGAAPAIPEVGPSTLAMMSDLGSSSDGGDSDEDD
ncbi:hypothetical protein LUZ62_023587 [Rhynchospora pubera]|uniref:MADS-box domain-containing protein n=1 Tax=Rhynchospora pubera TaxID=906938 RepID=A0AAV8H5E4_9POAL|nr:hypothetical protein LUZ62_023587 [Rhynchospora pubera]